MVVYTYANPMTIVTIREFGDTFEVYCNNIVLYASSNYNQAIAFINSQF